MLLAPALTQPVIAIAMVLGVVGVLLAWRSVAIPLALSGLPTLITAIYGTNPLPKGGATFLTAAWVGISMLLVSMRGEHHVAARAMMTWPVALSFLILALMVLRLSGSPDVAYGGTKVQLYAADTLVFLIGGIFVGAGRNSLRLFLTILLGVFGALGALLVFNLVTGAATQQYSSRFQITAQQGAINLGREAANGALIAICLIVVSARRSRIRWVAIGAFPLLLVALLAAGSRGPTLAFVLGLVTFLSLTAATGRARQRLLVVAGLLVGAAIVIPLVVPASSVGRSLSAILGGSSGLSSNGRAQIWAVAYNLFGHHPLFGLGTGGFAPFSQMELYPHNLFLEAGVELGVLGLVAVAGIIIIFLRGLVASWRVTTGRRQIEITLLISLFVAALVNAMFSGAIQDNYDIWLWGGIGLGITARREVIRSARADELTAKLRARTTAAFFAR